LPVRLFRGIDARLGGPDRSCIAAFKQGRERHKIR